MVSSEAAPLAKTGGLADVVGALPGALREAGCEAAVVIPRYGSIPLKDLRRVYDHLPVYLGPAGFDVSIYQAPADYPLYLVECPKLFDRAGFYGEEGVDYPDNHIRFAVFARAALGVARRLFSPDILHCHDWQSGLVPAYLRSTLAGDPTFMGIKTLFTIHNLGYQGKFPGSARGGGAGRQAFQSGRPRILRPGELHQERHFIRRRAFDRQPHVRARNTDAGIRLRPGRRIACALRGAERHSQRRGLRRVEPGDRPANSGALFGA
jgi:hypothetical protein